MQVLDFFLQILEAINKMRIALFFASMDFLPVIMIGQRCAVVTIQSIGFCTLCWHFFEHFSEAKALSIIRAF